MSWQDVLETWTPRLAPGMMSGATHGLIRAAHAVRSLAAEDTPERRTEFVAGLAYWAARYQVLPGNAPAGGARLPSEVIESVPIMPLQMRKPRPTSIFSAVAELDGFPAFEGVVNMAAPGEDVSGRSRLTSTRRSAFPAEKRSAGEHPLRAHRDRAQRATDLMAPYLSGATARLAARYAWQACAAITRAGTPETGGAARGTAGPRRVDRPRRVFRGRARDQVHGGVFAGIRAEAGPRVPGRAARHQRTIRQQGVQPGVGGGSPASAFSSPSREVPSAMKNIGPTSPERMVPAARWPAVISVPPERRTTPGNEIDRLPGRGTEHHVRGKRLVACALGGEEGLLHGAASRCAGVALGFEHGERPGEHVLRRDDGDVHLVAELLRRRERLFGVGVRWTSSLMVRCPAHGARPKERGRGLRARPVRPSSPA